jgi:long-chain fatty acid transport protein
MQNAARSIALVPVLCLAIQPVLGDGIVTDSIGAIAGGRGGTNIAHADNGAILLDNPGGLVNLGRVGLLEFSVDIILADQDYSDPNDSTNGRFHFPENPSFLPSLSYICSSEDGRWSWGLGSYLPAGFGVDLNLRSSNPALAALGPLESRSLAAVSKTMVGGAYRITDRLSLGAAIGVAVDHVEFESPFFLRSLAPFPIPSLADLQATGVAPTGSVGLQFLLTERTVVGLAYGTETRFRLDGEASADIFVPGLPPTHSRFDAEMDMVLPRSLGLGVQHDLCEHQRLSADVVWFDWSHAFDRVDFRLSNSSGTIRESLPLNWDDTVSTRLGYEYFISSEETLRAGYVFHPSPAPDSTLIPLIPSTLEHAFTLGYGRQLGDWRLNFAYAFVFSPHRDVSHSQIAGGDFDASGQKYQIHVCSLSLSLDY